MMTYQERIDAGWVPYWGVYVADRCVWFVADGCWHTQPKKRLRLTLSEVAEQFKRYPEINPRRFWVRKKPKAQPVAEPKSEQKSLGQVLYEEPWLLSWTSLTARAQADCEKRAERVVTELATRLRAKGAVSTAEWLEELAK